MNALKNAKSSSQASKAPISHGVGRRKSAVARVFLRHGKGNIIVNGKPFNEYFPTEVSRMAVKLPSIVYTGLNHYDVEVNVNGGGLHGQADAVKLAISRALVVINEQTRELLRENGLLTVDSRLKERKKYGQKAARRKFQFVKR
jgi:small subunit ribosomal protein S9